MCHFNVLLKKFKYFVYHFALATLPRFSRSALLVYASRSEKNTNQILKSSPPSATHLFITNGLLWDTSCFFFFLTSSQSVLQSLPRAWVRWWSTLPEALFHWRDLLSDFGVKEPEKNNWGLIIVAWLICFKQRRDNLNLGSFLNCVNLMARGCSNVRLRGSQSAPKRSQNCSSKSTSSLVVYMWPKWIHYSQYFSLHMFIRQHYQRDISWGPLNLSAKM